MHCEFHSTIMKFNITWPAFTLLAGQIPVVCAMSFAMIVAKYMWHQTEQELPVGSMIAIRCGIAVPILTAAASLWLAIVSMKNNRTCVATAFLIAIAEVILVAFFALGLVLPAMNVLWRMGNS